MSFKKVGSTVLSYFSSLPYLFGYIGRIFESSVIFFHRDKSAHKVLVMQLLFTFIEALPIVAILSISLGSALYIIGRSFLVSIGQGNLIYGLLAIFIVRELGPLLVAFVVTARSATAIAMELGGMVTSHQIESFVACGIDPIDMFCALVKYERAMNLRPVDLSMGEQKKIAFARALINKTSVLFFDECTESLDRKSGAIIVDLIQDFIAKGNTVIYVSHNSNFVNAMGGTSLVIEEGLLTE